MNSQNRVQSGVPSGGQFAGTAHGEAYVVLAGETADPHTTDGALLHHWERMGRDVGEDTRRKLRERSWAASQSSTPEILDELARSADSNVAANVAGNTNTSRDTLKQLSQHEDERVRARVVRNPSTPRRVVRRLRRKDPDKSVRLAAKYQTKRDKLQRNR